MLMLRRVLGLIAVTIMVHTMLASAERSPAEARAVAERALARATVIDTHADTPQMMLDNNYDLAQVNSPYMISISKMREGHLGAVFFSIWESVRWPHATLIQRTLRLIDVVNEQVARHRDSLALATTADDIERLRREGKIAVLMGLEGGHMIRNDLRVLATYHRLGIRYMTLTHSADTEWAGSSGGKTGKGLTEFGRDVIRRMNRLGMMVDVSHVSDRAFFETLAVTRAPVIASHSSCRAVCNVPRNMSDEMIRALAKNGGVIHINFFTGFVDSEYATALKKVTRLGEPEVTAAQQAYARQGKNLPWTEELKIYRKYSAGLPLPRLERLADHFDHAVQVGGVDHVGIGSDFDGIESAPRGLEDVSKLPNLVIELARRGYSEEDLVKILGGNTLRVMREVERVAHVMQNEK
jgi:membrane dipeptidase